jgi:predicted DNA-binding protein
LKKDEKSSKIIIVEIGGRSMKQTFITAIPLQGSNHLTKVFYEPQEFELEKNRESCFPIVPVVGNYLMKKENCQIIVIRTDNEDAKNNFEKFLEEIVDLGLSKDCVTEILLGENQKKVISKEMLMQIVDEVADDSLVYTDITFGTKPMSAIMLYAMNIVERIKDAEVQGIYYGEIQRRDGKLTGQNYLYDLTELKRFSSVFEQLDNFKFSDPRAALNKLFEI